MENEEIILEELREFRAEVRPWMMAAAQRMTALETNCTTCAITKSDVEERLRGVEEWHWRVAGVSGFVGGLVAIVGIAIEWFRTR